MRQSIQFKKAYLLLILLGCFCAELSAQYEHLLHKTYAQRYPYLYQLYQLRAWPEGDSAELFHKINAIAKTAADNHDEDLLLETRLLRANYYFYRYNAVYSRYNPITEQLVNELLEEAKQKNKNWLAVRSERMLAVNNGNNEQYEKMFEHYRRMYDIARNMTPEEFPDKRGMLDVYAVELYRFGDYREAILLFREGAPDDLPSPWDVSLNISMINSIGLCYRELNQLDSSDHYFRLAYKKAMSEKNQPWEGITSGNLGYNYFLRGEYEKAKPLLRKDADIAVYYNEKHGYPDAELGLAATALTTLADISLKQNDIKSTQEQLFKAREYAYRSGQYHRLRTLYPMLSKYYIATGNATLARVFFDSTFIVKDSLDKQYNTLRITRAQQKIELEQHRAELDEANRQKEIKNLQKNALIVIITLVLAIAFFIYDRQKRRYREKNQQLARTKEELEQAVKELNNFTRNISEKNKLIEELSQQLKDPDSEGIKQLQQSTILTDDQWTEFRNMFDRVYPGYLHRVKEKLPGLTPAETRFTALNKLRLSNKEMASMLGVGSDAIRQYRSRLRRKLTLAEDDNLEELLEKI